MQSISRENKKIQLVLVTFIRRVSRIHPSVKNDKTEPPEDGSQKNLRPRWAEAWIYSFPMRRNFPQRQRQL